MSSRISPARGPSPCGNARLPDDCGLRRGYLPRGPAGATVVSGTSFAAPQVSGAVALLAGMFPGATPDAIVDALVRGARDVGAPGATRYRRRHLNVAQAAALLAGADHAGPHVSMARAGRRTPRIRGSSSRVAHRSAAAARATAWPRPSSRSAACRRRPHGLSATPPDATSELGGLLGPSEVQRLSDGRHELWVRARDAAGTGARCARSSFPSIAWLRAAGLGIAQRTGVAASCTSTIPARELRSCATAWRSVGAIGAWHAVKPAARASPEAAGAAGQRAILRVRA